MTLELLELFPGDFSISEFILVFPYQTIYKISGNFIFRSTAPYEIINFAFHLFHGLLSVQL